MNFTEFMFILQFLAFIFIFLATLYNVFSLGKAYSMKMTFLFFIALLICYFVGMGVVMTLYDTELYGVFYQLESWILRLYPLLMIIQLFYYWNEQANKNRMARNSYQEYNKR